MSKRMPREQVPGSDEKVGIIEKAYNFARPYVVFVNNAAGVYLLWVFLHFASAHLYVHYCANMSFIGAIMSPILVSAPHCRALRWTINTGAQSIDTMWIVLGTWLCSKIALVSGR